MTKLSLVIIYFFVGISLLSSCRNNTKNIDTSKSDSIAINHNINIIQEDSLKTKLPIGKKELLLNNINSEITKNSSLLIEIFKYYDTINGIASPNFPIIKNQRLNSFYKPEISDSKELKDSFFLKSEKGYDFFKLVKEIPYSRNKTILIFEGKSSNLDYDGNMIFTNRKDIVVLDKNLNIMDATNIYYDYSDGIYAKTKLFFIDNDYTISIRYYSENEEGQAIFSGIEKYKITEEGKIVGIPN
ncbi:hypothetical protein [uncultured Aquimarina sp.]|uniref:hypothetical protein n=1 Tax=uncultured Aquimarina sp. TaxID=575652 RepID=UPI002604C9C2|nr:hypothetical protein [uncultured Aquimarina sp.]